MTCRNGIAGDRELNYFKRKLRKRGGRGVEPRWGTAEKAIKSAGGSLGSDVQRVASPRERKRIG